LLKAHPSFHAYSLFKNVVGCGLVQMFPRTLMLDELFQKETGHLNAEQPVT